MVMKSLNAVAAHVGVCLPSDALIRSFQIDSRKVGPGDLFFALQGEQVNGHAFLQEVASKGALGAVVSTKYKGPNFGLSLIPVKDVLQALQSIAQEAMRFRKEIVVAVTGSMGKTTTKEFLSTLLSARYNVAKTPGNQNTQIGHTLTILNLEGEYDVLVLELGMSEKQQIRRLVEIAPPDYAIVTRIAPAGIVGLKGGLNAVAEAKSEIFSHTRTRHGLISVQAASFTPVLEGGHIEKTIYGWKGDFSDPRRGDFVMEEREGALYIGDSPALNVPFEAKHLKENFLAAASAARMLGVSWWDIAEKAKELQPCSLRFEKVEREGVTFIQDCYNANPESVLAAIENIPKPKEGGKVIGVLGSMADLGEHSAHYHRVVGGLAGKVFDHLLSIGEEAKEYQGTHFENQLEVKKALFALSRPGDVVLIKGANRLKLWELLD